MGKGGTKQTQSIENQIFQFGYERHFILLILATESANPSDSKCKNVVLPNFRNELKVKQLHFIVSSIMVNSFTRFVNISFHYVKYTHSFCKVFSPFS